MELKNGIPLAKFEKGMIVFNIKKKDGFEGCVLNNQSRGEEAKFWIDDFLGMQQVNNEFVQTNSILNVAKSYITEQYADDFAVERTDQIELLNRSIDYFKTREMYDKKEFEHEVLFHPEVVKSFRKFESNYEKANEITLKDSFVISSQAVKKQRAAFKSVLKLDSNFHIYIHGDKQLIQKGVEKDGRKFYKIYYEEEKN
jgi:hypothetical protein